MQGGAEHGSTAGGKGRFLGEVKREGGRVRLCWGRRGSGAVDFAI